MTITTQAQTLEAVREFANILMATPQYQNFDLARQELQQDAIARQAIEDFQRKQQYLQMMQTWGVESPDDHDELHRLYERMMGFASVQHYVHCQEDLAGICRAVAQIISDVIGTDFVPQRSGCCG